MIRDPWGCLCDPIVYVGRCPDGIYVRRVIHTKKACKAVEELATSAPDDPQCALLGCEVPFVDDNGLCPSHGSHVARRAA